VTSARLGGSIEMICVICSSESVAPPCSAKLPPAVPVPRPRGVRGILNWLHNRTVFAVSSVVRGNMTHSGGKNFLLLS